MNKQCSWGTTVSEPLTVSPWCLLSSAQQQSSTTCCPSLSARCLIQERQSSYWACSDNPLQQQKQKKGQSKCHCLHILGNVVHPYWPRHVGSNVSWRTNIKWISMTDVQRETPGCCCRGCCSCSPLVLGQESSDFVQKLDHGPAGGQSGSLLQKKKISVKTHDKSVNLCLCFPNVNPNDNRTLNTLRPFEDHYECHSRSSSHSYSKAQNIWVYMTCVKLLCVDSRTRLLLKLVKSWLR